MSRLLPVVKNENVSTARHTMPEFDISVKGNLRDSKTTIRNLPDVCKAISRPEALLIDYFKACLNLNTDKNNEEYIFNGDITIHVLTENLYQFLEDFVLCPSCHSPETVYVYEVDRGKKKVRVNKISTKCKVCGEIIEIPQSKRGYKSLASHHETLTVYFEKNSEETIKQKNQVFDFGECEIDEEELTRLNTKKEQNVDNSIQDDAKKFSDAFPQMYLDKNVSDFELYAEVTKKFGDVDKRKQYIGCLNCGFFLKADSFKGEGTPEEKYGDILDVLLERREFYYRMLKDHEIEALFLKEIVLFTLKYFLDLKDSIPYMLYFLFKEEFITKEGVERFKELLAEERNGSEKKVTKKKKSAADDLKRGLDEVIVDLNPFFKWAADENNFERTEDPSDSKQNDMNSDAKIDEL